MNLRSMICAGALAFLMVSPALAKEGNNGNHYGWYKGEGGVTRSAPGPEIGIGLPALLVGGYLWYRRRYKQRGER